MEFYPGIPSAENQHPYYMQDYGRQDVRRVPSPESVSSLYCSSFNFDDMKSNIEEVSKEKPSNEHRHPVQHPAGNENSIPDQESADGEEAPVQERNHKYSVGDLQMFRTLSQQSEDGSTYNSISVSEDGDASLSDFHNSHMPPQQMPVRPHPMHYPTAPYGPPRQMMNNVRVPGFRPPHYPPMSQPCVPYQQNPQFSLHQQRYHLRNGYANPQPSIGFRESLSNISAPEPVDAPDYKRQSSKESSVDTSNFFVTMNPPDLYYENHAPQVKTVSGGINEKTTHAYTSPAPAPPQTSQPVKEKVKVFVTYAQEAQNPDHIRTVVQISQTLFKNSIEVTVDVLEETFKAVSISDWLESNITSSDFVLICISPSYRMVVDGQSPSIGGQNESAVNTQYIYRRIHAEYISQGSKNYRFIPVLVSGAQVQHIPAWLRDTKVFEWPKDYEDIIYRLFKQERFVRPTPGRAPEHTIQRYNDRSNSITSRKSTHSQKSDKSSQSSSKQ